MTTKKTDVIDDKDLNVLGISPLNSQNISQNSFSQSTPAKPPLSHRGQICLSLLFVLCTSLLLISCLLILYTTLFDGVPLYKTEGLNANALFVISALIFNFILLLICYKIVIFLGDMT